MKTAIFIATLLVGSTAQAGHEGDDDYQIRQLMHPTAAQLRVEKAGRVMIYDGLTQNQVNHAMTEQFHRIDSMMFVRTRVVEENGDEEVEEDGCDE